MPSYNLSGERIAGPGASSTGGGGGMGCAGNSNDECSCGSCVFCTSFFIGILIIIVKFG